MKLKKPKTYEPIHCEVANMYALGEGTKDDDCVYIGRPSKWGNPFKMGYDGDRDEVIKKYRKYLKGPGKHLLDDIDELVGKKLVCYCAPLPCHGEVLAELVDEHVERKEEDA